MRHLVRFRLLLCSLVVFAALCSAETPPLLLSSAGTNLPANSTTFTLDSHALAETRRINVYVPPACAEAAARCGVLYMPDGGVGEDFGHVVATVQKLAAERRIEPMLVVGIENTQRRRDLTGPTLFASDREIAPQVGGSAAFRAFLRDELKPEIAKRHRIDARSGIVGESLAGLFILEVFFLEPDLFDVYIALSPSVWWNGGALVNAASARLKSDPPRGKTLFLTNGDEPGISTGTAQLAETLRKDAPSTLRWTYHPMLKEHHDTIYRAAERTAIDWAYGTSRESR